MGDTFAPLGGDDDGLIELLWCNGHVVMQSQSQAALRKPPRPDKTAAPAPAPAQDDDAAQAWFQYPVEDPLERDDLLSELFGEAQAAVDAGRGACCKEESERESADVTCEPAAQKKTTTAKRRRAAEVHNLSERRRRDRINKKMKALQELIPYCSKTDKASMLDEAIEYLKSLQLQLQMMWMGGGMAAAAPVVFPAGVHQYYMQRMVAGPPPHHVASMPGMPFMAPPAVHQGPPPPLPDLYARYLAVDHHLPPPPPPPLVAAPYTVQQALPAGHDGLLPAAAEPRAAAAAVPAAASPADGILHKKYENCGKPEIQGMTG